MSTSLSSPYDPGANRTHDLRFRKPDSTLRASDAQTGIARHSTRRHEVPHKVNTTALVSLMAFAVLVLSACSGQYVGSAGGEEVYSVDEPDAGVRCYVTGNGGIFCMCLEGSR